MIFRFCIFFVCVTAFLSAEHRPRKNLVQGPYQFFIGPEIFHSSRIVDRLGTQTGVLGGARLHAERMKPSSLYLSLDGYAASGILSGQDRLHNETSLQSTEYEIEGRSGFSLCTSYFPHFMYTPYFGYGKFWGISHFLTPPETEGITLRNEFRFFAIGSNIRFILGNHLTLDFDARIKTITDARRKVRGPVSLPTLSMGEEFQYEADFPFTYHATFRSARLYYSIVPFWRQRHYGAFATSVRINNREKLIVVEDTVYQQVGARFLFGIDY